MPSMTGTKICYNFHMQIQENKKVQWIDVSEPKEKDIASLKKTFGLHPLIVGRAAPAVRAGPRRGDERLYLLSSIISRFMT